MQTLIVMQADQTGESLTAGRTGAGILRIKPKETDQRQPLQSVLWKVEPKGGKGKQELRQLYNFPEAGKAQAGTVSSSEGSSNTTRTKIKKALRPPILPQEAIPKGGQRTVRKPDGNTSGMRAKAAFSESN